MIDRPAATKNLNIAIFSETINTINVKLHMMVGLLFIHSAVPDHTTFSEVDHRSRSQQCQELN